MYHPKTHRSEDRIVSNHKPHVRPIIYSKLNKSVEFGAKKCIPLKVSLDKVSVLMGSTRFKLKQLVTRPHWFQFSSSFFKNPVDYKGSSSCIFKNSADYNGNSSCFFKNSADYRWNSLCFFKNPADYNWNGSCYFKTTRIISRPPLQDLEQCLIAMTV